MVAMGHTYWSRSQLFGEGSLYEELRDRLVAMRNDIMGWPADELLRPSEVDVVDHLVDKYTVTCPELDRDGNEP